MSAALAKVGAWPIAAIAILLAAGCARLPAAPILPLSSGDYSAVDTADKARALTRTGELQKVTLDPLQRDARPEGPNSVFLPEKAAQEVVVVGQRLVNLNRMNEVTRYEVKPHYMGNSIVPVRILVKAAGESGFARRIEVWTPPGSEPPVEPDPGANRASDEREPKVLFSP